jgi:pimeloyl-ACP methyl ester carboxylesterase
MSIFFRCIRAADGTQLHVAGSCLDTSPATCVLIHGYGEGGYVWHETCQALQDVCSWVAVDLRGHGESEHSRSGSYSVETHTSDVLEIIQSLSLRRVILLGHSLGGIVALQVAARKPAQVLSLVVVDVCAAPNPVGLAHSAANFRDSLRVFESRAEYARWLIERRPMTSAAVAARVAESALRESDRGFVLKADPAMAEARARPIGEKEFRWISALPAVSCRTLVLRGVGSAFVSSRAAAEMVRMLPNATLEAIPRAGHSVMTDNPVDFTTATLNFIRQFLSPVKNPTAVTDTAESN